MEHRSTYSLIVAGVFLSAAAWLVLRTGEGRAGATITGNESGSSTSSLKTGAGARGAARLFADLPAAGGGRREPVPQTTSVPEGNLTSQAAGPLTVIGNLIEAERGDGSGVVVDVSVRDGAGLQEVSGVVRSDGRFAIDVPRCPTAYGVVWVRLHDGNRVANRTIPYLQTDGNELDVGALTLHPARLLTVEVVDQSKRPIPHLCVYCVEPTMDRPSFSRIGKTDSHGKLDFVCQQRRVGLYALGENSFSVTVDVPQEGAYQQVVASRSREVELLVLDRRHGAGVSGLRIELAIPQDYAAYGAEHGLRLLQQHSEPNWITDKDGRVQLAIPSAIEGSVGLNLFCEEGGAVGSGTISPGMDSLVVEVDADLLEPTILRLIPGDLPPPSPGTYFRSRDRRTLVLRVLDQNQIRLPPGQRIMAAERVYSEHSYITLLPGLRGGDAVHMESASPRCIGFVSQEGNAIPGLVVQLLYEGRLLDRKLVSDDHGEVWTQAVGAFPDVVVLHYFPGQSSYGETTLSFAGSPKERYRLVVDVSRCWVRFEGEAFDPKDVRIEGCWAEWDPAEEAFSCAVSSRLDSVRELVVHIPGFSDQVLQWTQPDQVLTCDLTGSGSIVIDTPVHESLPAVYSLEQARFGTWQGTHLQDLVVRREDPATLVFRRVPIGTFRVVEVGTGLYSNPITLDVNSMEGRVDWPPKCQSQVVLDPGGFEEGSFATVRYEDGSSAGQLDLGEGKPLPVPIPARKGARIRLELDDRATDWIDVSERAEVGSIRIVPGSFNGPGDAH